MCSHIANTANLSTHKTLCTHNKNGQSVAIKIQLIEAKVLFQWAESK